MNKLKNAELIIEVYDKAPSIGIQLLEELYQDDNVKFWHTKSLLENYQYGYGYTKLVEQKRSLSKDAYTSNPVKAIFFDWYGDKIESDYHRAKKQLSLLELELSTPKANTNHELNKKIFMFWDSGVLNAPDIVKLSAYSYKEHNKNYEFTFLDKESLEEYFIYWDIFKLSSVKIKTAHKTDFIRSYLLYRYGGVWADATTICLAPLSGWLDEVVEKNGFFVYRQPLYVKDRFIKNWFLASVKHNSLFEGMLYDLIDYLFKDRNNLLSMQSLKAYNGIYDLNDKYGDKSIVNQMDRDKISPYFFYHYLMYSRLKENYSDYIEYSNDNVFSNCTDLNGELDKQTNIVKSTYKKGLINKVKLRELTSTLVESLL